MNEESSELKPNPRITRLLTKKQAREILSPVQMEDLDREIWKSIPKLVIKTVLFSPGVIFLIAVLPAVLRNVYIFMAWLVVSTVIVFVQSITFPLFSVPCIMESTDDEIATPYVALFAVSLNAIIVGIGYHILMK